MIGRLGKAAAEVALQFLADGMKLDDAVRAGAKLMDEELSPAAEMMLKQNRKSVSPILDSGGFSERFFRRIVNDPNETGLSSVQQMRFSGGPISKEDQKLRRKLAVDTRWPRAVASQRYAIRELLMDAAQGDPAVAAVLAKRLGFEGLL